jgi:Fe-S-cluster containining protein
MEPLSPDAQLPLTCTRSGSCCHGHQINLTPWEIALLAHHRGTSQRDLRDGHTVNGANRLRFEGPSDGEARPGCTFFRAGVGCSVHPGRPLACRVFPLARRRHGGQPFYTWARDPNPCLERCPEVTALPRQRLGDWLASQEVAAGEAAHDAYGHLIWGLLVAAALMAATGHLDGAAIAAECRRRIALSGDERIPLLPPPWYDLLTIPELPVDPCDGVAFVQAHASRLQQAIANDFALPPSLHDTAVLVMTMVIHLAPCVGIDQAGAVAAFLAETSRRQPALV